jgi:hypothetical protein
MDYAPEYCIKVTLVLRLHSVEETIFVHVPLHRGICEQDYVIDLGRYCNACSRPRYVTEDRVCWKRVRDARILPKDVPDFDTIYVSIHLSILYTTCEIYLLLVCICI